MCVGGAGGRHKQASSSSCLSYHPTQLHLDSASGPTGSGLTPPRWPPRPTSDSSHKSRLSPGPMTPSSGSTKSNHRTQRHVCPDGSPGHYIRTHRQTGGRDVGDLVWGRGGASRHLGERHPPNLHALTSSASPVPSGVCGGFVPQARWTNSLATVTDSPPAPSLPGGQEVGIVRWGPGTSPILRGFQKSPP